MEFVYEAFDQGGKRVSNAIDATSADDAMKQLHARGLFITQVKQGSAGPMAETGQGRDSILATKPGSVRDLMILTQQMCMMLRAGSRVVPALEAIGQQISKPSWRRVIADLQEQVETGSPLSVAMAEHPNIFDKTFRAIIAAGESAGRTADAFERLASMTKQQQQIKVKVIGALIYPALLMTMAVGVVAVLTFFVLPRFDDLYTALDTELPWLTQLMLDTSGWAMSHKVMVMLGALVMTTLPALLWRWPGFKARLDASLIRIPLVGVLARQIILGKIIRVWGTLVESNVPLLEGLELSRNVTNNKAYLAMMDDLIVAVSEGNSIGDVLTDQPLVPATLSSVIATGEQSGRMSESLMFLAGHLDEENEQSLTTLTRLVEPIILILMGLVVGVVAISLFLPLFDLTSAASGR
jgi:type II secretory pathway component PulF